MEGLSGTEDMLGSMTGLRQWKITTCGRSVLRYQHGMEILVSESKEWKVLRVQVTFSARDADLHQRRKGSGVWGLLWG